MNVSHSKQVNPVDEGIYSSKAHDKVNDCEGIQFADVPDFHQKDLRGIWGLAH